MKITYRIEIFSEIVIETNGLINPEEVMEEISPLMHVKESKTGQYKIIDYQSESNVSEVDEERQEIMEV